MLKINYNAMIGRLTVFLLISVSSIAQIRGPYSSTKFDKFINLKKVQWGSYSNNTIIPDAYNLSDELYKRFQKNEIKISLPISRDSLIAGIPISFLNKKDLEKLSFAPGISSSNNAPIKPTNRVDSNSASINIEEILYVTKGKLHSYIPWVSPKISVYTSHDLFIGTTDYFSSCINSKYNFTPSKRDKLVLISSTKKKILIDSIPKNDMLKQLYGINILEAIWDDLMNDKNEIIDLRSGQTTSLKNLKEFVFTNLVQIPVYDSLGIVIGTNSYSEPISPLLFQQIEITQNWYYDLRKNIVVNNISDITLFLSSKYYGELRPVLKIKFK